MAQYAYKKSSLFLSLGLSYILNCSMQNRHYFPKKEERMTKVNLKIQGMTCNHCVMRVAKALRVIPGVQDAQVDLQKAEAVVTYDDTKVSPDKMSVAVVEAGYKVIS
jgi:copper chaperone